MTTCVSEEEAPAVVSTRFFTVAEIADLLEMSERSVWRWIRKRELAVHRFGRAVRISAADFEAFLAKRRERP